LQKRKKYVRKTNICQKSGYLYSTSRGRGKGVPILKKGGSLMDDDGGSYIERLTGKCGSPGCLLKF
jgi:hypothetical protein